MRELRSRVVMVAAVVATLLPMAVCAAEPSCGTTVESWQLGTQAGLRLADAPVPPSQARPAQPGCLTPEHFFLVEDSDSRLLDPGLSGDELRAMMVDAANQLIATHGDVYDFIGFWTNFEPNPESRGGGAFYRSIRNDATGIGLNLFDASASYGLLSDRVQGMPMMYDFHLNHSNSAVSALRHEFGHRWLFFLNTPLAGGERLSKGAHVDCPTDNQGGTHGQEWRGEAPARVHSAQRNLDTRERYGWLALYLMGLASESELDNGSAELRFMTSAKQAEGNCLSPYHGPVSSFDSRSLVDSYGPRIPAAGVAQSQFRVGWVVFHLPGETPPERDLRRLVRILGRFGDDWQQSTLGRSSMDHQLFPDADCDGQPD